MCSKTGGKLQFCFWHSQSCSHVAGFVKFTFYFQVTLHLHWAVAGQNPTPPCSDQAFKSIIFPEFKLLSSEVREFLFSFLYCI